MLNQNNERELAYIVKINDIKPIEGKDRVECAVVSGWNVMIRKNQFHPGDLGIYFEIDSKVPETEPYKFLEPKKYKIKTQTYKTLTGKFYSQGLLMSAEDFGWILYTDKDGNKFIRDGENHVSMKEGTFLTKQLGITYYEQEDNIRKAPSIDKYKKMAKHCGKLFSHQPFRFLMKTEFGKKLLFMIFGRNEDKKNSFPEWVEKTDEDRIQNMPDILNNKEPWIVTEKIDGISTTFTITRNRIPFKKNEFYVCSRNVCFDNSNKDQCFYDTNVYLEMAKKYNIEIVLNDILNNNPDYDWVTIQGETYGGNIQKRNYSIKNHDFRAFNFITSKDGRWNSVKAKEFLSQYGIEFVPILDTSYILPDTVEEMLEKANGNSALDGIMREGLVLRSQDGKKSFKAVSNEYLIKYHN